MPLKSESEGSAPLELVGLLALMLLPIGPMLGLFTVVSDQLAAESIARHGLRYAFLSVELGENPRQQVGPALEILAQSWGKQLGDYSLDCTGCLAGGFLELRVRVGSAVAHQSAGLEPN